jgi:ABC-type transport system substrate-binding protein
MTTHCTTLVALSLIASACAQAGKPTGSASRPPAAEAPASEAPTTSDTPPTIDPATAEPVEGVEAIQLDGVWTFEHRPEVAMTALHSGAATIVDGCLVIDDLIIVWHADRIDEAKAAVAAAKAGSSARIQMGGGGLSLSEGSTFSDLPTAVTDVCPTAKGVWFQAPRSRL